MNRFSATNQIVVFAKKGSIRLPSASKIAAFSMVAMCLLISAFLAPASYSVSSFSSSSSPFPLSYAPAATNATTRDHAAVAQSLETLVSTLTSPNAQENGIFGSSVAASGNTIVIGAPYETASNYSEAGHAYIFNAKTGALVSTLTSPNAQTEGWFGWSVAASGNTIVIGAPDEAASGYQEAGHAYIFNATTGGLIEALTSPKSQKYGFFGEPVAVSGSTVVVGATDETASGYHEAGHAYIFNATTGSLIKRLTSPNAQKEGWFGSSLAISGTTVVVGAYGETASGYSSSGHAYIFNAKTGSLMSTLTSPNAQKRGYFGGSVAISGTVVVVGAYGETASGYSSSGHAYIFNAKTGSLMSTLTSPNAQLEGFFGWSVAASGNTVVVGAYDETASGYYYAGHAYVFSATTSALINTLTSPNAQTSGNFGTSVAESGSTVVVGAPFETASGYPAAGHAYTYTFFFRTLTSPNAQLEGFFGTSVAESGSTVVVGAYNETASGYSGAGHAYIFNAKTGALEKTLTSPNAQSYGSFGWSVAVSGNIIVVGAPFETASEAGDAYIFSATTGGLIEALTSPNAQSSGRFGWSVAVSGSTVVVGAPDEAAYAGDAYIFSATTGDLISTLTSPNAQTYGSFGWSVAVSGSTVVVGALGETVSGYSGAGHAYIINAASGSTVTTLTSPNAQSGGFFGTSVAVSGSTVVVGALGETVSGYADAGHAYIFSATTGALVSTLTNPDAQFEGFFGTSVAVNGSTVVVGANGETAPSGYFGAGDVYIFSATTGDLISMLTSPNAAGFGTSVALSDTVITVGAPYENASGILETGHAYIF